MNPWDYVVGVANSDSPQSVVLNRELCTQLVAYVNTIIEAKNTVVRENHELARKLMEAQQCLTPAV